MKRDYQICTRCIMDTSDHEIEFDEQGVCNHCKKAIALNEELLKVISQPGALQKVVNEIKQNGKGKKYDCIIGVSGGVDSTYVAYKVKELGLRPLAVHLDNGWNSELAVSNIQKILKKLDIDLYTYVIDWNEFKDLQLSFLRASTTDGEIPTDHAIRAILYKVAASERVDYIINGCNTSSESILPRTYSTGHGDWKYIKSVQKIYGTAKLKTFPHLSFFDMFYFRFFKKINNINLLDYIDYDKEKAIEKLQNDFGWQYYGGKHYESMYTRIYQSYILPTKFNVDKRKAHLSSLIASGQMTRDEALKEMKQDLYDKEQLRDDIRFLTSKFGISEQEFEKIMALPVKTFWDYPSYQTLPFYKVFRRLYRFLTNLGKIRTGW